MKKAIVVASVALVVALAGWQLATAEEESDGQPTLPEAAVKAVKEVQHQGVVTKVGAEPAPVEVYEVDMKVKDLAASYQVTADGAILMSEMQVTADSMPAAVKAAFDKEVAGGKVKMIEKAQTLAEVKVVKLETPKVGYEAVVEKDGKTWEIAFDADGKVTEKEDVSAENAQEGAEKPVTIDQVPPAVKATLLKEAGKAKFKELDEEIRGGKKVYTAEWVSGGKTTEIMVAPDGKILEKKVK